jgi:cell division protein FtsB
VALADEVTIRFTVQVITMLVSAVNLIILYKVNRLAQKLAEEQQYLLDYRKEIAAIRRHIHDLHPDDA